MSKRLEHIHQLDSLRTIAAFMVIFHHYLIDFKIGYFDFGKFGVEFFFTISGFLITSILLKQKESDYSILIKIKNFIIKRALRLFPVYYIVLFFFTILSFIGLYAWDNGEGIYYYTYTTNFLFYFDGQNGVQLNHLWTLAIEEQFYLFWPLIIFVLPLKRIKWAILFLVLFSLAFKFFNFPNARMLTISHFDTLGSGALLAYLIHSFPEKLNQEWFWKRSNVILLATLSLLVLYFIASPFPFIIQTILVDTIALLLIWGCVSGFKGSTGYILSSKPMIYLGKISYGLYIYHKPIPYFLNLIQSKYSAADLNKYLLLIISILIAVAVSHFSFVFIEKRFISLKEKYDL